jgi:hypothetical protein
VREGFGENFGENPLTCSWFGNGAKVLRLRVQLGTEEG